MKRFLILALGAIAALAAVATDSAEAARMGGGRSLGAQRQSIAPPSSTTNVAPASPVAPSQALPSKVAPAASGASRWMGPLAGLAAGIGLAALLSHFGLSEGFADILMLALLVFGGIFLIRDARPDRRRCSTPAQVPHPADLRRHRHRRLPGRTPSNRPSEVRGSLRKQQRAASSLLVSSPHLSCNRPRFSSGNCRRPMMRATGRLWPTC